MKPQINRIPFPEGKVQSITQPEKRLPYDKWVEKVFRHVKKSKLGA